MTRIKLNTLLAKTDHLASQYRNGISEYTRFFRGNQGAFKGEKRTYTPREGTIDMPGKRVNKLVVTTVDEKFEWLEKDVAEYVDALFSQERTNSVGVAKADLIVDGVSWGELTSLELLKLKSFLESGLPDMYSEIPVRNDDELWERTREEMYDGRAIYASAQTSGVEKTTLKEHYILKDPNIDGNASRYTPQVSQKDTIVELGDYTFQRFSGEWSHRQRAELLQRRSQLLTAVIEALKVANDVESVPSPVTAKKIFDFIHKGDNGGSSAS